MAYQSTIAVILNILNFHQSRNGSWGISAVIYLDDKNKMCLTLAISFPFLIVFMHIRNLLDESLPPARSQTNVRKSFESG
jgi:hypothetical protein